MGPRVLSYLFGKYFWRIYAKEKKSQNDLAKFEIKKKKI